MNDLKDLYSDYLRINLARVYLRVESEFLGKLRHSKVNSQIINFLKSNCKSIEIKTNIIGRRQTILSTNFDIRKRIINIHFIDNPLDDNLNSLNESFLRLIQPNLG